MPSRIKMAKQRLVMAKMVRDLMRTVAHDYMGMSYYGSAADDALLLIAIYIGQAERRLMKANKLADYIGMPRSTVVRKLREMKAAGLIDMDGDGSACLVIDKLNEAGMVAAIERCVRIVQKASAELSKMDSKGIAGKWTSK